jgi:hypothetical protein
VDAVNEIPQEMKLSHFEIERIWKGLQPQRNIEERAIKS